MVRARSSCCSRSRIRTSSALCCEPPKDRQALASQCRPRIAPARPRYHTTIIAEGAGKLACDCPASTTKSVFLGTDPPCPLTAERGAPVRDSAIGVQPTRPNRVQNTGKLFTPLTASVLISLAKCSHDVWMTHGGRGSSSPSRQFRSAAPGRAPTVPAAAASAQQPALPRCC